MVEKILVGPLLGIESNSRYTFCFFTRKSVTSASVQVDGIGLAAERIDETPNGLFWRAQWDVPASSMGTAQSYSVALNNAGAEDRHGRNSWQFYVPGADEKPRIAYASCNGFSSLDLKNKTEEPYLLWDEMVAEHIRHPFSLLLMGGDQLYADELWTTVPKMREWGELPRQQKIQRQPSQVMLAQLDSFYEKLYRERWGQESMSLMLASVPSIMMWDDHDIFDGWGSYPKDMQACPVYQAVFTVAKKYFELFQIRSHRNGSLLGAGSGHYAFAVNFRRYHILALDNRGERSLTRIMSEQQWTDVNRYLDNSATEGDLLVLSGVPVVYRDFSLTETVYDATPWQEELTDDLKDHWRAKEHQGERARLIMRLLSNASGRGQGGARRTVLLSGDVHIGCLGVINDRRNGRSCKIHQVVSSGIVHPSPSRIAWLGIMAVTNDEDEYLNEDHSIKINMLKPFGSNKYIRSRNFVTLLEGSDQKLWVNWVCEHDDNPGYPLEA